jgi:hypothetical protein
MDIPVSMDTGAVTEFRNITENCNVLNGSQPTVRSVAVSHIHAPWSGGEQCKQDPCRQAYRVAPDRVR